MPDRSASILPHLLIVDDDKRLRELLEKYLSENGFRVTAEPSAAKARTRLSQTSFDLMVLDVMMPGQDGVSLTKVLRNDPDKALSTLPILLLTAMSEADNRISGLESGADDYLTKPFEPKELVLRINAILKRTKTTTTAPSDILLGGLRFDLSKRSLNQENQKIPLTSAEEILLSVFAQNPGRVLSREELAHLSGAGLSLRTVDVQITRLRRKIEDDPRQPQYLKTVRHKGYVLWPD